MWAGEHADINLITALPRATAPGLQVQTDDGWVDAVAPEGQVIINTGMMLERAHQRGRSRPASTGWWPTPDQPGERYTVVQFCHPTPWTILSPVAVLLPPDTRSATARIEAGDLLDEVLYEINLVEDARRWRTAREPVRTW